MPSALPRQTGITKLTNCRLVCGNELINNDLWVSSATGTILSGQSAFYDDGVLPDDIVDLGGRIVSPGLIDVQLNGAFGFNFSTLPDDTKSYAEALATVNKKLVATGVTSYLPTLTTQRTELYQKVLPYLRPEFSRRAADGAESLGAHVEGPFLNPGKNGIHDVRVMRQAHTMEDIEACYGAANLKTPESGGCAAIKKITLAPELAAMTDLIPQLTARGIVVSIGHSEATYEEAANAVTAGATMITHLFNAMRPLHHRNPGIFGVLGVSQNWLRPYFGIIADGIHLHPTAVAIAYHAHPEGLILVTDAMHLVGLPDGAYPWANGDTASTIVKHGYTLRLAGTDKIAGSSITLIECVNNFLAWTAASVPCALKAVTATPAAMLGLSRRKGCLDPGADADLVIISEEHTETGAVRLVVDEVWKFGTRVYPTAGTEAARKSGNSILT